jgi:hypothetical protein
MKESRHHDKKSRGKPKAKGDSHGGKTNINISTTGKKIGLVTESFDQPQDGLEACGTDAMPESLAWLLVYMLSSWSIAVFFLALVFQGLGLFGSLYETGCCLASLTVYALAYGALPQIQCLLRWTGAKRWSDPRAWLCVITIHVTVFSLSASCACQFTDLKLRWLCGYLMCTFQIRLQEGINCISLVNNETKKSKGKNTGFRDSESKSKNTGLADAATLRAAKIMSAGCLVRCMIFHLFACLGSWRMRRCGVLVLYVRRKCMCKFHMHMHVCLVHDLHSNHVSEATFFVEFFFLSENIYIFYLRVYDMYVYLMHAYKYTYCSCGQA